MQADPLESALLSHEGDPDCGVTVLTVATKMEAGAHNMLASLRRYGYKYRVLGWGQVWKGWRQRMAWYRDSAREYAPDAILVYLDAYDIVAARSHHGLLEAYERVVRAGVGAGAAEAQLVLGMEALCMENCGHIGPWWLNAAKAGRKPTSARKFLNGGVVMGRAAAIADAYDWVLKDRRHFEDDQIGLAAYINAHPHVFAPDDGSVIVKNKHAMQRMSSEEARGEGAFFLHYPGVNRIPPLFPINEAWKTHAGRMAVLRMPTSPVWDMSKIILWICVPLLLVALGLALGTLFARSNAFGASTPAPTYVPKPVPRPAPAPAPAPAPVNVSVTLSLPPMAPITASLPTAL